MSGASSAPPAEPALDLGELYPFESHYLDLDGVRLHYVDEGEGEPVIMLHGNPTWSFYYRKLILALRGDYRVVAPDHIGCGLSDKPGDAEYTYTLSRRVEDLERLLDELGLKEDLTLVLHDWGGMIGMIYAARHPDRVKRLIAMNTSAFHLPPDKRFPWLLWLARNTPIGPFLIRRFNAFSLIAARVCCTREPMSLEARRGYLAPYDSWRNRIAVARFVQDIPLRPGDRSYALVSEVEGAVSQLAGKPVLLCWGMKDFVFDASFLQCWEKAFPRAETHRFEDCGHYVLEDASTEIVPLVADFLRRT